MWDKNKKLNTLECEVNKLKDEAVKLDRLTCEFKNLKNRVEELESKLSNAPIEIVDAFIYPSKVNISYKWDIVSKKDFQQIKDILESNNLKYKTKDLPLSVGIDDLEGYKKVKEVEDHYENPKQED